MVPHNDCQCQYLCCKCLTMIVCHYQYFFYEILDIRRRLLILSLVKSLGKRVVHFPSVMQDDNRFRSPHGPCIMFLEQYQTVAGR